MSHLRNTIALARPWTTSQQTPKPSSAVPQTQGLFWEAGPGSVCQSVQLYLSRGWGSGGSGAESLRLQSRLEGHSQRGSSPSPRKMLPPEPTRDSWVLMPLKPACRPALRSRPIFLGGSFRENECGFWSPVPTGQGEGAGPEIPGGLMDAWTGPHPEEQGCRWPRPWSEVPGMNKGLSVLAGNIHSSRGLETGWPA